VTRTVRPATPADAEELVRLAAVMFNSMGLDASAPEWQEAGRQMTRRRLGTGDMAACVVDGDEPGHLIAAGAVIVAERLPGPRNPTGRAGYIQWVATDAEYRRQGLGRHVLEGLLAWLAEQGVAVVELHATPDGETLYRSLGFGPPPNPQLVIRP
jgi:ribosomal protein S18 acetylase RimI-like enzyme